MGSAPKMPKAPPPPPAPIDEADRAPIDAALAKKSALSMLGYRKNFIQPRGPDEGTPGAPKAPDWQQPENAAPEPEQSQGPVQAPGPNGLTPAQEEARQANIDRHVNPTGDEDTFERRVSRRVVREIY